MTPAEIIYQRRIAVLEHAGKAGDVAACRVFGISRTRYYEWKSRAKRYGLDALMPKERRAPQMPEATPTMSSNLLTLAVLEPTIGCRQYADRLGDRGFSSPSRPCKNTWWPTGWAGGRAPGPGGGHHRGHDRSGDRRGPRGRALRVLPGQRRSGRARLPRQLLHREAQGRGQGVPAHRHRRLHPLGLRGHRARPGHGAASARFVDRSSAATAVTGSGSGPCSPTTVPNTTLRPSAPHLPPRASPTNGSHPAPPTTTPCSNGSTAPPSKNAGGPPSTGGASPASPSSKPKPTPGSCATTPAGATTPTSYTDAPPPNPRHPPHKQGIMTTINRRDHLTPPTPGRKH